MGGCRDAQLAVREHTSCTLSRTVPRHWWKAYRRRDSGRTGAWKGSRLVQWTGVTRQLLWPPHSLPLGRPAGPIAWTQLLHHGHLEHQRLLKPVLE
jgi:hypothetical protein